ncbi:MAG: TrmJ/YjtD family RNA methyltransferase [Candidatus Micrarchaeota archaeon]|nr:TrmJ/YjtD family RNA methyltransferase [Candidatus Micrarchaeota archaeon]
MILKVIIVSPKYQNNLGYIARVSSNFGVEQLHLVKPRAKLNGKDTIMYSKHARNLIEGAKIYPDFKSAIKDCDLVVGTTGVLLKARSDFRKVYLPEQLVSQLKKVAGKKTRVALAIGRDDTGLSKEEMDMCDFLTFISTNPKYPVLNISHALGIMLYVLTDKKLEQNLALDESNTPNKAEVATLFKIFDKLIENKRIRNRKTVKTTFRRIIALAQPTRREVHALITALKK